MSASNASTAGVADWPPPMQLPPWVPPFGSEWSTEGGGFAPGYTTHTILPADYVQIVNPPATVHVGWQCPLCKVCYPPSWLACYCDAANVLHTRRGDVFVTPPPDETGSCNS